MPSAWIRVNIHLPPYKTSSSPPGHYITLSGYTSHTHSGHTNHFHSGCTKPISSWNLDMQHSPLLVRSMEQEIQITNDAHNSLLKTLCGKWAGKVYYDSLRMAIQIKEEIRILTASNWPSIDLQLPWTHCFCKLHMLIFSKCFWEYIYHIVVCVYVGVVENVSSMQIPTVVIANVDMLSSRFDDSHGDISEITLDVAVEWQRWWVFVVNVVLQWK